MGTLIGAFIISVIQNGMNLLRLDSYLQQVVLGAVILGAVLMDKVRSGGGLRTIIKRKRITGTTKVKLGKTITRQAKNR